MVPFATQEPALPAPPERSTPKVGQWAGHLDRWGPRVRHLLLLAVVGLLAGIDLLIATLIALDSLGIGLFGRLIPMLSPVLAVVAVVAVARRRSDPVLMPVLLGLAVLGVWMVNLVPGAQGMPSSAAVAALLWLLVRSVATLPPKLAATAALISPVAVIGAVSSSSVPETAVAGPVLAVGAVGAGCYLRWLAWRRDVAALSARSDERLQMARELHDSVGHHVTGIVVQAQAARLVAEQDAAASALEQIEREGREALAAMRAVVADLREEAPTAPHDDWSTLDGVLSNAAARGVPLRAWVDPAARELRGPIVAATLRIVTEALTNVERHARSVTLVTVQVTLGPDQLLVEIRDDGWGAAPGHPTAFGLIGMTERAHALGGSLEAGPAPEGGWTVRALLPRRGAA